MLDHHRYSAPMDQVQALPVIVAAGAHGPVVRGDRLGDAFRMLRTLPHAGPLTHYAQTDLEDGWPPQRPAAPEPREHRANPAQ